MRHRAQTNEPIDPSTVRTTYRSRQSAGSHVADLFRVDGRQRSLVPRAARDGRGHSVYFASAEYEVRATLGNVAARQLNLYDWTAASVTGPGLGVSPSICQTFAAQPADLIDFDRPSIRTAGQFVLALTASQCRRSRIATAIPGGLTLPPADLTRLHADDWAVTDLAALPRYDRPQPVRHGNERDFIASRDPSHIEGTSGVSRARR